MISLKNNIRIIAVFENVKEAEQCVEETIENYDETIFLGYGKVILL